MGSEGDIGIRKDLEISITVVRNIIYVFRSSEIDIFIYIRTTVLLMVRRTTSIKIDDVLWKRVKMHCLSKDLQVSEFVEDVLRKELDK